MSQSAGLYHATNGTEYTTLGNANTGTNYTLNTFLYGDNFTWLKNRHTFKFGVQFLRQQQKNLYPGNDGSLGGFYFLGAGSANAIGFVNPNGYKANGYTAADFMLNRAGFASVGGVAGPVGMRSWRDAYFAQDDWKLTPTLTLNLGIGSGVHPARSTRSTTRCRRSIRIILRSFCSTVRPNRGGRIWPGTCRSHHGSVRRRLPHGRRTPSFCFTRRLWPPELYGRNRRESSTTTNLPFQSTYQASGAQAAGTNVGNFFLVQNGFSNPASGAAASGAVYNVWNKDIKPAFIGMYTLTVEYQ